MSLANRATTGDVVWIRRSVVRHEPDTDKRDDSNSFQATISASVVHEPDMGQCHVG